MAQPFTQRVQRQFVGGYRPKIDGRAKASGQAEYLDDIAAKLKGVLFAGSLRSPYPHARIKRMDTRQAEALPGVRQVLRFDDPEVAAFPQTSLAWTSTNTMSFDRMYYKHVKDTRVLEDTARWVGDDVGAVVAADSQEILEKALELIEVEWEQLPFVLDRYEAKKLGAPIIHPEVNPTSNVIPGDDFSGADVFFDKGDVAGGFAKADVVVEVAAQHNLSDHSCLDTRGCLMLWEGGKLSCWTNYYAADQTRMHLSHMLKVPMQDVRVMVPFVGGNFGRCNMGEQPFFLLTAILARRTGRPVRYKLTRHEDFHDTRNPIDYKIRLGAMRDGTIVAAESNGLCDTGAYHGHGLGETKWVISLDVVENLLAHLPNIRCEGRVLYTNKVPAGCMKGAGNVQFNFAWGLAIDVLAEKLGLDPMNVYLKNCGHEWEELPSSSLVAVLKEGAERIGWKNRHKPGEGPLFEGSKRRGVGFSCHDSWHSAFQEVWRGRVQVQIKLNPDMSVILQAPTCETGSGSNSCSTFACAEALSFLGVSPDDIRWISLIDTETGLKDMVQTDSCCSYLQSELMPAAAAQIRADILDRAVPIMEVSAEELDIAEGMVFVKSDPKKSRTVREVLWSGDFVPLVSTVTQMPAPDKTGAPIFGTFVEVEVDQETGKVEVLKLVQVNDCGTVMFGAGAEGQQIGGQCLALGECLTEEFVLDEASGAALNFNWIDYHVPTMLDFPEVEPVLLEVWRGAGEYGACGMGEGTGTCTARAVANAVYNAIGVRVDDTPLSPAKVLQALGELSPDGGGAG